ncbi:hypothetical protein [Qaidamihabitans albus]|uniref:hypothetical protein n=1 Tax=Qaidamihabitans albus TaxID=2795733 RepID=UPI0018F25F79|nr:hypothetical protein [Qaidamihabitans albus]
MADEKPALVIHLATGGDPLLFQLPPEATEQNAVLTGRLHGLLGDGTVETVRTKDGFDVNIDFGKVAVAYVDDLQRRGKTFGLR